jgi:hypothetical protein
MLIARQPVLMPAAAARTLTVLSVLAARPSRYGRVNLGANGIARLGSAPARSLCEEGGITTDGSGRFTTSLRSGDRGGAQPACGARHAFPYHGHQRPDPRPRHAVCLNTPNGIAVESQYTVAVVSHVAVPARTFLLQPTPRGADRRPRAEARARRCSPCRSNSAPPRAPTWASCAPNSTSSDGRGIATITARITRTFWLRGAALGL